MRSSRPLASSENRRMRCRDCGTCEQEPTVFFHVSVSVSVCVSCGGKTQ